MGHTKLLTKYLEIIQKNGYKYILSFFCKKYRNNNTKCTKINYYGKHPWDDPFQKSHAVLAKLKHFKPSIRLAYINARIENTCIYKLDYK